MKEITSRYLKECLSYYPDTGEFYWRTRPRSHFKTKRGWRCFNSQKSGMLAGNLNSQGYVQIYLNGRLHQAHRLAWVYMYGDWPSKGIDHINQIRDDNRINNLRDAAQSENVKNAAMRVDNTSGHTGVYWNKEMKKWKASIASEGKQHHIGYFNEIEDAIIARKKAETRFDFHPNHGFNSMWDDPDSTR